MISISVGVVVVAILVVSVLVARQPSELHVRRSITMAAPPTAAFREVNCFPNWKDWSPWERVDPNLKRNYAGPPLGKGAVYAWAGNRDVGEGRLTILESTPSERIVMHTEFFQPCSGVFTTEFTFRPDGESTVVSWTMSGSNGFMGRVMGVFLSMDRMIGDQFEKGLVEMKRIAESKASDPVEGSRLAAR